MSALPSFDLDMRSGPRESGPETYYCEPCLADGVEREVKRAGHLCEDHEREANEERDEASGDDPNAPFYDREEVR